MALEGRCMGCRKNREMRDVNLSKTKRGTFMAKGTCTKCGTKMARILSVTQAEEFKKKQKEVSK
ncbi:MAG: hypothetical protein KJ767_04125 [Nanoarchaeota archaeon]|nr:hypothetical protein [Nanoarchaeota archaeon]